jgi:hypothetical protein
MGFVAVMEGGLDYHKLRDTPLRELDTVTDEVNKYVEARNRESKRTR